ncbi:MAG: phospholipid carrier-dependent glycosyltransferase [Acidobacteriota bacterium]
MAAFIALLAWALGRQLLTLRGEDPLLRESARLVVGLAVIGTGLFGLGVVGWLRPLPLLLAAIGLAAIALAPIAFGRRTDRSSVKTPRRPAAWLIALGGAGSAVLALYPATAFDVTLYHLPYVRAFADAGSLVVVPQLRYPIFPQLLELLAVPLYLVAGETATSLLSTLGLLAVAAGLLGLLRRSRAGYFAAALWLGSPLAMRLGGQLMVEITLTAFIFFGLVGVWRLLRVNVPQSNDEATARRDWAILAGVCLGAAAACKYLGLFFLAVPPLLLLGRRGRSALPWLVLCALLVAGPWYARLTIVTGNPVFPFFESVFGTSIYSQEEAPVTVQFKTPDEAIEEGTDLPAMVASLVLGGRRASRAPPFNPWLLVGAFAALALRPTRSQVVFGLPLVLYALIWPFLPRDPRFLLPVLPWLAIVGGAAFDRLVPAARMRPQPTRVDRSTVLIALGLLLPGLLYGILLVWRLGPTPLDDRAQQRYRTIHLPGYPTLQVWRQLDASDAGRIYLLGRENLQYFGDGQAVGDHFGPLPARRVIDALRTPCHLADLLRAQQIEYLLVAGYRSTDGFEPCLEPLEAPPPDTLWRVPDRSPGDMIGR